MVLLIDIGSHSGYLEIQGSVAGKLSDSSVAVRCFFHIGIISAPYISMPSSGMKAIFSPCNIILGRS